MATIKDMLRVNPDLCKTIDTCGNTPLHEAIQLGRVEIASLLIESGADVNASGNYGDTPLHYAVGPYHEDTGPAKLLIQSGANIEKHNNQKETPLMVAVLKNPPLAEFLLQKGATLDLNSAVMLGITKEAERLLDEDPQLARVSHANLLFHQAAMVGSPDLIALLASRGLKPDSLALFESLSRVISGTHDIDSLKAILDAGADANGRMHEMSGETALEYARSFQDELFHGERAKHVVALLKEYGATEQSE
jgi:cytohesin